MNSDNIQITVNGQNQNTHSKTLAELLAELNIKREFTAVALNYKVIPASAIQTTLLNPNDKIEIIRAISGG